MSLATKQKLELKKKRVDSPLAKYNGAGQLFCVLCNAQVKNEIYWTGHVNGKQHRDNLLQLKQAKRTPPPPQPKSSSDNNVDQPPPPPVFKRPAPPPPSPSQDEQQQNSHSSAKIMRLEVAEQELESMAVEDISSSNEETRVEEEVEEEKQEPLPAGFFDDPKEDAKARGQKFKDPQEAEWERFVKEIATEDLKSTEIVGVEEQATAVDRELEQIEEQMVAWQRVIELEKKAEEKRNKLKAEKLASGHHVQNDHEQLNEEEEEEEHDEELDYDEEMDWRNKKR